ncbi:glycosyltransferase family 4 protein [Emticicia sp. BO119]|uniref:glycosyltransferase family 4 protein n=1 Tax=Emticicia sp. BO119 TaxID=2757768 RepID=UPI0015F00DAA|nr:glycosyltransferase family 4 protein [Emticicia sp. BO119]MBA4850097.1 glycosyltransferase family 4 protein [Emticicia sp. BO119]
MNQKTILFITPTGGRTGSEMLIWYLLKHLSGKIRSVIYSCQNGELFANDSTADLTFVNKTKRGFLYKIYEGVYYQLLKRTPEESRVLKIQKKVKADKWYLNTLTMPRFARLAKSLKIPYHLHVHELVSVYDEIVYDDFRFQFDNAEKIICCSAIVEQRIRQMGYANTVLLHSFIDTKKIHVQQNPLDLRQKLNIPKDAYIWLMSGSMNLRKGYDLALDLLAGLPRNTYLLWLGNIKKTGVLHYLEQRTKKEKLNFIQIGEKSSEYYDYLNLADGFVLLAREDPFPLVMIEAAFLQKPIAGFDSGGIAEFSVKGMGTVVKSFNPKDLAEAMIKIQNEETEISKEVLKNRALDFDIKNQINKWVKFFNEN